MQIGWNSWWKCPLRIYWFFFFTRSVPLSFLEYFFSIFAPSNRLFLFVYYRNFLSSKILLLKKETFGISVYLCLWIASNYHKWAWSYSKSSIFLHKVWMKIVLDIFLLCFISKLPNHTKFYVLRIFILKM